MRGMPRSGMTGGQVEGVGEVVCRSAATAAATHSNSSDPITLELSLDVHLAYQTVEGEK